MLLNEWKDAKTIPAFGRVDFCGGVRAIVQFGPAVNYSTFSNAKHQFSRCSRDDPADLGAGKPLAHQVSPKQLLGSGACGLLEIFLNQQICYWTGVLCTGRQLADARLGCGVYSPFRF